MYAKSASSASSSSSSSSSGGAPAYSSANASFANSNAIGSGASNHEPMKAAIKKLTALTAPGAVGSIPNFDADSGVAAVTVYNALTGQGVALSSVPDVGATFTEGAKKLISELQEANTDIVALVDIGQGDPAGHRLLFLRICGAYLIIHCNGVGSGKFTVNQWITELKTHSSFTSPYAKILDMHDVGVILTMLTEKNLTSICKMLFNNGNLVKHLSKPIRYVINNVNLSKFNALKSLTGLYIANDGSSSSSSPSSSSSSSSAAASSAASASS